MPIIKCDIQPCIFNDKKGYCTTFVLKIKGREIENRTELTPVCESQSKKGW